MTSTVMPAADAVGPRAAAILAAIKTDQAYQRLESSSKFYADCWATFTGYPIVALWNLDTDKHPLFVEAMRALSLKAAVYELTDGDEVAAELLLPLPVDEMTHAVLAQHNLVTGIQVRLGILLPHMTDLEQMGFEPGDYTAQCYTAAGWGEPPARYWIGTAEAKRRLGILSGAYERAAVHDNGRRHDHTFELAAA